MVKYDRGWLQSDYVFCMYYFIMVAMIDFLEEQLSYLEEQLSYYFLEEQLSYYLQLFY